MGRPPPPGERGERRDVPSRRPVAPDGLSDDRGDMRCQVAGARDTESRANGGPDEDLDPDLFLYGDPDEGLQCDPRSDLLVGALVAAWLWHEQNDDVGAQLPERALDLVERRQELRRRLVLRRNLDSLDRGVGDRAVDRKRQVRAVRSASDANGAHRVNAVPEEQLTVSRCSAARRRRPRAVEPMEYAGITGVWHVPACFDGCVAKTSRPRWAQNARTPAVAGILGVELGGLEPPTSWVRSRRSPN
jgi:hypothetical protein